MKHFRVKMNRRNKREREVEDITLAEDISEDVFNQTISNITTYSSQTPKSQATGPPGPPQPVLRKTPPGPPISFQKSSSISTKPSFGLLPSGKQGAWYDCCTARLSTHPDFEKPFLSNLFALGTGFTTVASSPQVELGSSRQHILVLWG